MADALRTLARIRRLQADLARRALADALRSERQAIQALQAAQQVPLAEAAKLPGGAEHPLASSFAVWLPAAMDAIGRNALAVEAAASDRADAVTDVAACKAAVEAVGILLEERARVARKAALKAEQVVMDEFFGGRSKASGSF